MSETPRTPSGYETAATLGREVDELRKELTAERAAREKAEEERDALKSRLNPSIDYDTDGTPVGYGDDEIDRLQSRLAAIAAVELPEEPNGERLLPVTICIDYAKSLRSAAEQMKRLGEGEK